MADRIRGGKNCVYRFDPHGSKKIEDLTSLHDSTEVEKHTVPEIYCCDQEPLNYDLYEDGPAIDPPAEILDLLERKGITFPRLNFRGQVVTIWDQAVLLHSEKRSRNVDRYQATQFIPVYYWSHAVIALDWFRYAQHVTQHKQVCKTFLIYNRAWAGTREYRLRFAELLVHLNLQAHCKTSINPIEPDLGLHYETHKFKNPMWRPQTVLENYFPISDAHSHYSADFDMEDYAATDIEIVLETLFDDDRLHLTEKSLRPIACAQPFILAGTHGSLEYLRSYGFKTFSNVWDESYDLVQDPAERLIQIAELMKYITNWTSEERVDKMARAQAIADYNRQHFFSDKFFNLVNNELETNLTNALTELENTNTSSNYLHRHHIFVNDPELHQLGTLSKKAETIKQRLVLAHHYNSRNK
jgi:hypothetical protein